MVAGVPTAVTLTCPREKSLRAFVNIDGGTTYRCAGCEWSYGFGTTAPTGTDTAIVTAGTTVAITVASGGASFTTGMLLLFDTTTSAEVVVVGTGSTGTNIPVPGGFIKNHSANATFGQLLLTPSFNAAGEQAIPAAPGWGF
jgi:hypothetical protein